MNAGTRVDHNSFCVHDEWVLVRNARGAQVGHHVTYELRLTDGRVLRTRISRSIKKVTYGPSLRKAILRDQLDVTEPEFWSCVKDTVRPVREATEPEIPPTALPAGLVDQLIRQAGIPESDIAAMTLTEAIAKLAEYWSTPPEP